MRRVSDSAYHWYGESATPRITDTRSRWLPVSNTNISANSKPKSERLEWYCKGPMPNWFMQKHRKKGNGNEADFLIFYLMLIFSNFAADHGLINYIETKAKGCHLKKFTCKGTLRQVFIRVYRLELHFNHILVFLTQLCELLTLQSSLRFESGSRFASLQK